MIKRSIIRTLFGLIDFPKRDPNPTGNETVDVPGGGYFRRSRNTGSIGGRNAIGDEWVDWTDDGNGFRVNDRSPR